MFSLRKCAPLAAAGPLGSFCTFSAVPWPHPATVQELTMGVMVENVVPGSSDDAATLWAAHPEYAALRRHLVEHQVQLMEVLEKWDDGDGCVSAKEFRQGWRVLELDAGLSIPRDVVDELYEELDLEESGNIPFEDLALGIKLMPVPEAVEALPDRVLAPSEAPSPRSRLSLSGKKAASQPLPQLAGLDGGPRASPRAAGKQPASDDSSSPRSTNLPRLKGRHGDGGSHEGRHRRGANHHDETMSVAASHCSMASGCSSSTAAGLSPAQKVARRAIRERELAAHFARYNLPGFNVPGPGQYEKKTGYAGSTFHVQPGASPWSADVIEQHYTLDTTDRPIDMTKITNMGDPGRYVSRNHEMGKIKNNLSGISFSSPLPQRPIALVGGQPSTLPWQTWNGK